MLKRRQFFNRFWNFDRCFGKKNGLFSRRSEGFNYDITYVYNGKKLVEANYVDGTKDKYYYTGDLITKIEYLYDGEVEDQDIFIYNSDGKLIEYKDQNEDRFLYSYNADNTITETYFVGSTPYTKTLTFENDEISKVVYNGLVTGTYKYSYDTKNSPFKNVTGYAKIAYAFAGDFELEGRSHNIALIRNETDGLDYMKNTFQYNSSNYPTTVVSEAIFDDTRPNNVEKLTVQYFY